MVILVSHARGPFCSLTWVCGIARYQIPISSFSSTSFDRRIRIWHTFCQADFPSDYYNYDSAQAFNYSSNPVGRFANEFGYHSMPSLQSWRQAVSPSDLHFNTTTIQLRNHHYPPGDRNISNFVNTTKGMGDTTIAAQRWYPVRASSLLD